MIYSKSSGLSDDFLGFDFLNSDESRISSRKGDKGM
jgi:hypothetical protein